MDHLYTNDTLLASAKFDRDAVRTHFSHLHSAASRADVPGGKLVLAVYGEDPDTDERFANVQHFAVGDIEGMTAAAMAFDGVPHHNIYAPLAVLKPETPAGTRKEEDIAAVLGLVVDGDADKGNAAPIPPLPADYVIESSTGNLQYFLFLDSPLAPAEAKAFGRALRRATSADGADDIGHVWRVPGCLNWPNKAKLKRGRSREPQPVRVHQSWTKWTRVTDLRARLAPHGEKPRAEQTAVAVSLDAPKFDPDRIARWIDRKVAHKWKDDPDSPWNDQGEWILFGKAIKISFPNEDGFDLWMHATHDGHDMAEKRWNNHADFKPEMYDGALTLKNERYLDSERDVDWMFGDALDIINGKLLPPTATLEPLRPGTPLPEGWHWSEEGTAVPPPYDAASAAERRSLRDRRVNAASLAGKPVPERQWLVPGWIPMEQVTLLYGDGAVGKSLLALLLGSAAAVGTHWFGQPVKQGPVEFLTAEDSAGELHRRLADISREKKQPHENMRYLKVSSFADEDAIMAALTGDGQLVKTAFYDEVVEVVQEAKPVLLVLDTLADIYGGNEVVRAQARAFINMLRKIAIGHHMAVVVLAHPSLDGMRTGKGTSGSTGWSNSVRSRLYLDRVHDEQGMEPDTDARVLRSMKMNYGNAGNEIRMRWRGGIFVPEAGGYSGGDPLVTAIKAERVFIELLAKFTEQNRYVSVSEGRSYAPFVFASEAAKQGVNKHALKEAMERLITRKRIENAPYGAPSKKMFRLYAIDLPTPANALPTAANAP